MGVERCDAVLVGRNRPKADHPVRPDQHEAAVGHPGRAASKPARGPSTNSTSPSHRARTPSSAASPKTMHMMLSCRTAAPGRGSVIRPPARRLHRLAHGPRRAGCRHRTRPASPGCAGLRDRGRRRNAGKGGICTGREGRDQPHDRLVHAVRDLEHVMVGKPHVRAAKLSSSDGRPRRAAPAPASRRCRPRPSARCSGPHRQTGSTDGRHRPAETAGRRPARRDAVMHTEA